ncbi:hypothetical protein HY488_03290 [Candidatus Woesearchaeota archaeon]|nr:hypothetical protein [Candidatus Woesearchaeota archaeon]
MANKRVKPLIPTLREKNRYIAFEILSKGKIPEVTPVSREIWKQALQLLGELETAKSGLWVLADTWDGNKQRGVLKVNTKYVNQLKASLALITMIADQAVIVRTTKVSGILRKIKKITEKNTAG